MTDLASSTPSASADTILGGKYVLGPVIGTGGMGTVYRATHAMLGRSVAVKLMHPSGDPLMAERFLREGQVAAAARHPNVVDIFDFGTTEAGQPFMVMELLEGRSLREVIEEGPPLSFDEQIDVFCQVLAGLDAVHRAGIVHRDIKPANVFLCMREDGTWHARLLDFGISFSLDPASKLRRGQFGTDTHLVIGTPEYMSIEQCEGRPDVDARADVHAMGVMLYEMLTGEMPYTDPHPGAVLYKVIHGKHTPLVQLRPDLPEIAAVVEDAISNDREQRPASARIFRRRILEAAGRPVEQSSIRSIPPLPRSSAPLVAASQTPVRASLPGPLDEPSFVIDVDMPAPRRVRPRRVALGLASLGAIAASALVVGGWVALPMQDVSVVALDHETVAPAPVVEHRSESDVVIGAGAVAPTPSPIVVPASAPLAGPSVITISPTASEAPRLEALAEPVAEPVTLERVTDDAPIATPSRSRTRRGRGEDTRTEPADLPPPVTPETDAVTTPVATEETLHEITPEEAAALAPIVTPEPSEPAVDETSAEHEAPIGRELDF